MESYYDERADILCIHKGFAEKEEFDGNIVAGDIVLDSATSGRIRGIEILNATRFFEQLGLDERHLSNLIRADFSAEKSTGGYTIGITLKTGDEQRTARVAVAV